MLACRVCPVLRGRRNHALVIVFAPQKAQQNEVTELLAVPMAVLFPAADAGQPGDGVCHVQIQLPGILGLQERHQRVPP